MITFICSGVTTPKHRLLFVQMSSDSTPTMCLTKVTAPNSDFNLEHGAPASLCLQRCSYRSFSLQGNLLPGRCKSLTSLETLLQRFSRVAGALLWSTSTTIWHCDLKSGFVFYKAYKGIFTVPRQPATVPSSDCSLPKTVPLFKPGLHRAERHPIHVCGCFSL